MPPVGLSEAEIRTVIDFALAHVGDEYDLANVVDLARYLCPTPPVPSGWRRRMIALGSGEPTKAICSTLVAQAFQSIRYPILPEITRELMDDPECQGCVRDILHIRHHSLFTPRDFDVSPFFEVVKPTLAAGFDFRTLHWHEPPGHNIVAQSVILRKPDRIKCKHSSASALRVERQLVFIAKGNQHQCRCSDCQ